MPAPFPRSRTDARPHPQVRASDRVRRACRLPLHLLDVHGRDGDWVEPFRVRMHSEQRSATRFSRLVGAANSERAVTLTPFKWASAPSSSTRSRMCRTTFPAGASWTSRSQMTFSIGMPPLLPAHAFIPNDRARVQPPPFPSMRAPHTPSALALALASSGSLWPRLAPRASVRAGWQVQGSSARYAFSNSAARGNHVHANERRGAERRHLQGYFGCFEHATAVFYTFNRGQCTRRRQCGPLMSVCSSRWLVW